MWFHADKLSSAHIYLRMNEGESWESIPEDLLTDCAQLTKANSIEGGEEKVRGRAMLSFDRKQKRQCYGYLYPMGKS